MRTAKGIRKDGDDSNNNKKKKNDVKTCGENKWGNGWQRDIGEILLRYGKDMRLISE